MRATIALLAITLTAQIAILDAVAQTTTDQTPPSGSAPPSVPTPAPEATPAPPPAPTPPSGPKARDFQGLDVFGADGHRIGKVVRAAELADGKAGDLEVQSPGFFGYFSSLYVVPAGKATLRSGRVDLSVTSSQAKQWIK